MATPKKKTGRPLNVETPEELWQLYIDYQKKKTGRPLNVETPEELWQLYIDYQKWCEDNPIKIQDFVGKDGDEVERKKIRPLTIEGYKNYCYRLVGNVEQYLGNMEGRYPQFVDICTRIKEEIRQHQLEGGLTGLYNPSITARINNLKEQVEQSGSVKILNIDPID